MPRYEFQTVDVFTDRRFGGNPLAVFPSAEGLSSDDMLALAAEFNLSETTFVLPPDDPRHSARVRIFGPRGELPFAGHPNVGTAYVLARAMATAPEHFTFEEPAGLVRVHVLRDPAGTVTGARVSAPRSLSLGSAVPDRTVAACAGLTAADIVTHRHAPLIASVGMPFAIAEVADLGALARAAPDPASFRAAASAFDTEAPGFKLLLHAPQDDNMLTPRMRMFAPLMGVNEDPATGSAAAALAALLTARAPGDNVSLTFEITQGIELGRPSRIIASARKTGEGPVSATVAGHCVPMLRGEMVF
ncbi:MAG: PhzF family phenazine biosynthesis protein [Rhodospirillales bacterium]|jgi:trans-2,3-dihydro-3-hydroxyanthranilate isomerase|nr:PhzF family phenazine biosynthesis protein [Rhodospirillales bacterium]